MCESGAWRNFEDFEATMTLDELMLMYETTSERQKRMMKMVAAAMGADVSDEDSQDPDTYHYKSGEIAAGNKVLFGYKERKVDPEG